MQSRLEISDWKMAKNDAWIYAQHLDFLDDFHRVLMNSVKVSFITGK